MEQPPEKIQRVERLNEMPRDWQILREKILNNFESKTDGLNIERVKEFMKEHGFPVKDFILFEEEDMSKLQKLLGTSYDMSGFPEKGIHLIEPDLVLVLRQKGYEEKNGSVYTESMLIHELAHASSGHLLYINTPNLEDFRPRAGFRLSRNKERNEELRRDGFYYGTFLEEGFAEMLRGDYMEKNVSARVKEAIFKELENLEFDIHEESISFFDPKEDCKTKYIYMDNDGGVAYAETAIAATGLEMLCEKQPKLKQVLIEARSDIEKLREISKLINAIKPGLYMEIQKNSLYTEDDFARVQNIIKKAIQNS